MLRMSAGSTPSHGWDMIGRQAILRKKSRQEQSGHASSPLLYFVHLPAVFDSTLRLAVVWGAGATSSLAIDRIHVNKSLAWIQRTSRASD